jgi:hypothetical protein
VREVQKNRNCGKFQILASDYILLNYCLGNASLHTKIKKNVRNFIPFAETE